MLVFLHSILILFIFYVQCKYSAGRSTSLYILDDSAEVRLIQSNPVLGIDLLLSNVITVLVKQINILNAHAKHIETLSDRGQ